MPTNSRSALARHAHYLEQYINGIEARFLPFLARAATKIRGDLLQYDSQVPKRKQDALLSLIADIMKNELDNFVEFLDESIAELAVAEAEFQQGLFKQSFSMSTTMPAAGQLRAAVYARPFQNALLKDYLDVFTTQQAALVRNAVAQGFFEGKTTPEIVRNVIGTKALKYQDGIINVTRTSAERMVRTSLNHTANAARASFYDENSDVVKYYEWVSTLDSRTSDVCKGRDGEVYELGKGPLPPAHPNCRSTTSPLFDEDVAVDKKKNGDKILNKKNLGGTRASENGQVSADLNYNDWLGEQSKEFQDDALGPTRAKLFREGGLTVDKFTNDRGQQLTLDELKAKFPTAWGKIQSEGG